MLENVVDPNAVNVFLLLSDEESPKAFNTIVFEATTELIAISHVESSKTLFMVHVELSFIVLPITHS